MTLAALTANEASKSDASPHAPRLGQTGVDTCSYAFRPDSARFFDRLLTRRHRPTAAGGLRFDQPGPGNTALLAWPAYGLVAVEGRLGALCLDDRDAWDLQPKIQLARGEEVAREAFNRLADWDMAAPTAELRRYDLTAELEFSQPAEGFAFLRSMAGMLPPRRKVDVIGREVPETVYFRSLKRLVVHERFYDKGRESGSHAPGHRIRLEVQQRPQKARRQPPTIVAGADLRSVFGGSINAYVGEEKLITAGPQAVVDHLAQRAASGEISWRKATSLIGSYMVMRSYGRHAFPDVQQQQRRIRALREAGLDLNHDLPPDALVPVGELLAQAVEQFTA